MQAQIIPEIIDQHAEEASFLWLQRNKAVHLYLVNLEDLIELDDRLEAHIDGLRIAGDEGWEICKQALEIGESGEVFTAGVIAFEGEDGQRIDDVVKVAIETPENWRALISAIGWISGEHYQRWLPGMLRANSPTYRRLAITTSAIRRQDPGEALAAALDDPEPYYQARALRAVGELKRRDLLPVLQQKYMTDDTLCRFWAAWSAVLLGDKDAIHILKTFSSSESPFLERTIQLMLRVMDVHNAEQWLSGFSQDPEVLRYAVLGAGIIGDPLYVPWLIKLMAVDDVARVAGESFSMITGVDLAYDDLEGEWPEGFEAGPTENPQDEDVAMDQDEDLPWPEANLIQSWWEKNNNHFRVGVRYLVGKSITVEHCQQVLNSGFQRHRRAAAIELALLQPDSVIFNTSASGFRQQQLLR